MGNVCCVDDNEGTTVGITASTEVSMGEELKARTDGLVIEQPQQVPAQTQPAVSDEEMTKQLQGAWKRDSDRVHIATVQNDTLIWVPELSKTPSKWRPLGEGKLEVTITSASGQEMHTAEFRSDPAKTVLRWDDGDVWVREELTLAEQMQGRWKRDGDSAVAAVVQDGNIVWAPYYNVTSPWKEISATKVEITMAAEAGGGTETHIADFKWDLMSPSLTWDDGEVWIKANMSLLEQIQGSWKRAGVLIGTFKDDKLIWVPELGCDPSPCKVLSTRQIEISLGTEKHTAELKKDLVVPTLIWGDGEVWIKE